MATAEKKIDKIRQAGIVRNAADVETVLRAAQRPIRQAAGSHLVTVLPDGRRMVYHQHGEYGSGLGRKLFKILSAAGLITAAITIAAALV